MSGTDHRQEEVLGGPAVVLVEPQLGENIGFVARAMLNCGLTELRLVAPRDGWPNPAASAPAAGADRVLEEAKVFDDTDSAIADLSYICATTARHRDFEKTVLTPRQAAREFRQRFGDGVRSGLLFGKESSGLRSADIVKADALVTVPLNPAFASLNLGQAVLLVAYEWFQSGDDTDARARSETGEVLATKGQFNRAFLHLEQALDDANFFRVPKGRPKLLLSIRTLLTRAELTRSEVSTLHGMITALTDRRLGGDPRGRKKKD